MLNGEKNCYAFAPDSYLQWELEASFLYEDTPDQGKRQLQSKPIWKVNVRWIVWFVVMWVLENRGRHTAAFKAVDNSKQVAVLVPTTILAFQHLRPLVSAFKTFQFG